MNFGGVLHQLYRLRIATIRRESLQFLISFGYWYACRSVQQCDCDLLAFFDGRRLLELRTWQTVSDTRVFEAWVILKEEPVTRLCTQHTRNTGNTVQTLTKLQTKVFFSFLCPTLLYSGILRIEPTGSQRNDIRLHWSLGAVWNYPSTRKVCYPLINQGADAFNGKVFWRADLIGDIVSKEAQLFRPAWRNHKHVTAARCRLLKA